MNKTAKQFIAYLMAALLLSTSIAPLGAFATPAHLDDEEEFDLMNVELPSALQDLDEAEIDFTIKSETFAQSTEDVAVTPMQAGNRQHTAAGNNHSLTIHPDGTLWTWGDAGARVEIFGLGRLNELPQHDWIQRYDFFCCCIGEVASVEVLRPTRIGIASNWISVSAGVNHSLGIRSDGTLWAWGSNEFGQLGDGTTAPRFAPVQIGIGSNWTSIAARGNHSLGIRSDGTLWTWGNNEYGQIGDGTTISRQEPIRVGAANNWSSVSAGVSHSFGIRTDGTLWGWGRNYAGELGDGTAAPRLTPTRIGIANDWIDVSGGMWHSLGIRSDGTLWSWGFKDMRDDIWFSLEPVRIGTASDWTAITASQNHSFGIRGDGALWGWGFNQWGSLGDGTTNSRFTPVRIGTASNWASVSTGPFGDHNFSLGLKRDGTLWTWGAGRLLGDGGAISDRRLNPTRIDFPLNQPQPTNHTITFNSQGGSAVAARTVAAGQQIGTLPIPTKANYTFNGWWTAASGGTQVTASTVVNNNMTLHARWISNAPTAISINPPASNIVLRNRTLNLSQRLTFTHNTGATQDRTVTWTSSNTRVATVNASGVITGRNPGTATIRVRSNLNQNATATFAVRVEAAPTGINTATQNIRTIRMRQGRTLSLPIVVRGSTATALNNTPVTINWRTSNRNVATLRGAGTVTNDGRRASASFRTNLNATRNLSLRAVGTGTTSIVLTSQNGRQRTIRIQVVRNARPVTNVRIANLPSNNTMNRNRTRTLRPNITPNNATLQGNIRWTSSNRRVATVDGAGRVTTHRSGTTNITLRVGTQTHRVMLRVR